MSRKYRPNKRRRSQAFPEEHETVVLDGDSDAKDVIPGVKNMQAEEPEPDPPDAMQVDEVSNGERPLESEEELSRRQEMWEVFQEEHHEVLDQLPLSLQRSYSLISELDDQVNTYNARILSTLKEYVAIRKSIAAIAEPSLTPAKDATELEDISKPTPDYDPPVNGIAEPTPSLPRPTRPPRQLLTHAAQMTDYAVRSSREKISIACFTHGLVDRYIRDLDRAIKEQEAAIAIGLRPGTHPAHIILPEVLPPSGPRGVKSLQSSLMEEEEEEDEEEVEVEEEEEEEEEENMQEEPMELVTEVSAEPTVPVASPPGPEEDMPPEEPAPPPPPPPPSPPPLRAPSTRRGKGKRKKTKTPTPPAEPAPPAGPAQVQESEFVPEPEEPTPARYPIILKISRSALSQPPPPVEEPWLEQEPQLAAEGAVDPDDRLWCICKQVRDGEMIGCDSVFCETEWYHLECLGISRIPKGKWICDSCKAAMKANKIPKTKHRRKKR